MKLTKSKIKEIITEELGNLDSSLMMAINNLASKIDNLDVSIDYLAGAVTGESPAALGYAQGALGRFAKVIKPKKEHPLNDPSRMNEIVDAIVQELRTIEEEEKYKKSFYKAKEERAEYLIDKGVPEDQAYGVADKQMSKAGKKKKKE